MTRNCYLNGDYLPLAEARISPMDRGFLFADAVYEVIPVYNRKPFHADEHLIRLQQSLSAIHLSDATKSIDWKTIFDTLIKANPENDQSIYLQITRGTYPKRDAVFPAAVNPTIFVYSQAHTPPNVDTLRAGITAITLPDIRWQKCYIKATTLLANVLMRQQAIEAGAQETILLRDDHAIEATASNLFIVQSGVLITPPTAPTILGGVTREVILKLAKQHQIPYQEMPITKKALFAADEIWLTGSLREVAPVVQLDGQLINHGKAGAVWEKMMGYYQAYKQS